MTKQKKKKTKKNKVISICCLVFAIFLLVDLAKRLYDLRNLRKQKEIAQAQVAAIKDENASLESTKEKLEDPDYVQTYAKGQYMFTNDGEIVFILPGDE